MPEMSVTFERKISDGNFGSQGLSLTWTGPLDEADPLVAATLYAQKIDELRRLVLASLAGSNASNVAWVANRELNPPPPPRQPVAAGTPEQDLEDLPF